MSNGRKKYTVTELMSDESFQNYCLSKNKKDEEYWKSVILKNWNQRNVFEEAYLAVQALSDESIYTSDPKRSKVIRLNQSPSSKKVGWITWIGVSTAAAIALFFIVANYSEQTQYLKIATDFGEKKTFILPDSSIVTLNANSMLVYEETMNHSREVQLVGEGYFEVITKDDLLPFEVQTQHGNIFVTGTIFNVRSRNYLFESTLLEGGITFKRSGKNDVILSPGDHLNISNNSIRITKEDATSKIAWRDNRLYFKEAKIKEIAKRLSDDFGLTVEVGNKRLYDKKISANIVTSDPMVLLESMAVIYDFSIIRVSEDKVLLK
ncbi:MAG: FecR domain-containing protein [Bacteroidota bacterium]